MEFLLDKITDSQYKSLDEMPISDWVNAVAEGKAEYVRKPKPNSQLKSEYRSRKK
jgi:hypothetical protein